ncbi:MAG: hypothetical protein ACTSRI_15675 [Promethearchaeota archaeon]
MVRIERKIEIKASQKSVYDILADTMGAIKWNITAKEITEISEGKYAMKSTVGDFTTIRTERVENERLSVKIEGGIFNALGYILSPKGDMVEVTLWGEFDDPENEKILLKAGEILLKSLKKYVEYIEEGGDPEKFDK